MEYEKIVAVTGLPGLYELVSSKNDGAIVRALEDKSTRFVSSRVHNFSHLESIEVYTTRDNVNLVDIFTAMEKSGEKLPGDKDNNLLKKYFEKVYPELDFDRVYASDMKKMVKWFGVLKANNVEIKLREVPEEEEAPLVEEEAEEKPVKEKKAAATAPAKKPAKAAPASTEKEPAKAKKEKVAEKEEAPKKKAAAAKPAKEKEEKKKEAPAKKKAAAPKKSAKK